MRLPYLCLPLAFLLGCEEAPPLGYFTDVDGDGVEDKDDCDPNNPDAGVEAIYYPDYDHDGYGDLSEGLSTCDPPDSYVTDSTDCDDTDASIHPGAEESCDDAVDRNCDGSVAYEDNDGDGWAACIECDDSDATVHPEATETCDGRDEDCDGEIDEDAEGSTTYYADADGDGFGNLALPTVACNPPEGTVVDATDCDDDAAAVNPAATEVCNAIDDDCDGLVDNDAADAATWYGDGDSDGYGDDSRLEY
ncbi:MAG: putative metal-binding motif-containing protein, partial [Deltaproteobacteria bacterium]|nr:putative metal-binding motif-containing protein [Deltaproteobacteria bacterium]